MSNRKCTYFGIPLIKELKKKKGNRWAHTNIQISPFYWQYMVQTASGSYSFLANCPSEMEVKTGHHKCVSCIEKLRKCCVWVQTDYWCHFFKDRFVNEYNGLNWDYLSLNCGWNNVQRSQCRWEGKNILKVVLL